MSLLELVREALSLLNNIKNKPKDIIVDREDNIVYIAIEFSTIDEAMVIESKIKEWKRKMGYE